MATVQVSSWSEFLTAAAVAGDTVECPEGAVWDLAEIEPEGHNGTITINANINGNGLTIKNLVQERGIVNSAFYYGQTVINDMHIINANCVCGSDGFFSGDSITMNGCTISALIHDSGDIFYFGNSRTLYRCAFNIELANATALRFIGSNANAQYCNAKFSGSRVTELIFTGANYPYGSIDNCYFVFDTPAVQDITANNVSWSVIRCTGSNVLSLSGFTQQHFCLGVTTDFPNASSIGDGIILVSESQLCDAAYLQSIGFPIGVSD